MVDWGMVARSCMVDNRGSMVAGSSMMHNRCSMMNSWRMINRSSMVGRNGSRGMDSCYFLLITSIAMNTLGGSMRLAADRCMVSTMGFVYSMAYRRSIAKLDGLMMGLVTGHSSKQQGK